MRHDPQFSRDFREIEPTADGYRRVEPAGAARTQCPPCEVDTGTVPEAEALLVHQEHMLEVPR